MTLNSPSSRSARATKASASAAVGWAAAGASTAAGAGAGELGAAATVWPEVAAQADTRPAATTMASRETVDFMASIPSFSYRVMAGPWTRENRRSTGEEVRHGAAKLGLDHRAHMAAGNSHILAEREQIGERLRRAIVAVLLAAQHQRRHGDLRDLRLGRIDERVEQRQQGLGIAAGGLQEGLGQPFWRAARVGAEAGQDLLEMAGAPACRMEPGQPHAADDQLL